METTVLTPMMQQWLECKTQAKGALLLFRLGDFYEAFEDDAKLISKELELTLTQRQETPMCGIPAHASEGYIERLVMKGHRVAIADQVEDPKKAKGLVSRKLVRIVSPATHIPGGGIQEKTSSYFVSITNLDGRFGLAVIDLASASFTVYETDSVRDLTNELFRISPKEILLSRRFQAKFKELLAEITVSNSISLTVQDDWLFDPKDAQDRLLHHFNVTTLDGFGLKTMLPAITAAGALLHYLGDWQLCPIEHITTLRPQVSTHSMFLDRATLTNLEILEPTDKARSNNSLVSILDETKTAMGARLLRQWLKAPLIDVTAIKSRQDAISDLMQQDNLVAFDEKLCQVRDLERMMYRIKTETAGPKEFVSLRQSLEQLPFIKSFIANCSSSRLKTLSEKLDPHTECAKIIRDALVDNPPFRASDGGLFKMGYNDKLDELLTLRQGSQNWLVAYQERLKLETGIKTLKVGYTRMFGYYIEVSRAQTERVPDTFQRRQTLTNGERYISHELKEYEEKILSADSLIEEIEQRLFQELRKTVASWHDTILQAAKCVAQIDVLRSLAIVAKMRGYVRPEIIEDSAIEIREGRHPIIESLASTSHFVANDLVLDGKDQSLICLTGPNMAGKSTYIRQVALLVIMAQIGSSIPASRAKIGVIDKVFSRIGASDDLARGQSTFMVEMAETASILHQATERSLVILDEIGRGTSTYDGISIAWAVAEHLLKGAKKPKTLFATHYYELTELATKLPGAVNYTVAITETQEGVLFLRRIVPGVADKSYGIHVARLAGMPQSVIARAEELLKKLEQTPPQVKPKPTQPDLFVPKENPVIKALKELDITRLTPIEALVKLDALQKQIINLC
ncbi:MAG: DNA mismatch repair protein MutS [Verrucomicrobia bacterium]|nr:DNA mismatch repair protein MutS [Verrucomicrobiota bacterium]